jgi:hypothetical protein
MNTVTLPPPYVLLTSFSLLLPFSQQVSYVSFSFVCSSTLTPHHDMKKKIQHHLKSPILIIHHNTTSHSRYSCVTGVPGSKRNTTLFVIFPGKYKALGLNVQTSQARSVLLRPRALYFPVQITKAGCIPLVLPSQPVNIGEYR